ncbi:hypothetical protein [Nocardia sp. NPDC050793]|uniref:hypothetical protein n=1 Tax=Nocardia sp. NPDC050793 TaxID=3155159 RepID=UPI0033DF7F5E
MSEIDCQYCAHRNLVGTPRCEHCGAPLRRDNRPGPTQKGVVVPTPAPPAVPLTARLPRRLARLWRPVAAAVFASTVLVGLAWVIMQSSPMEIPRPPVTTAADSLPASIRGIASCRSHNQQQGIDRCVISAHSPMLSGGLANGLDLPFYIQLSSPDQANWLVGRWRGAGSTVVSEGRTVAAISPANAVLYLDTVTGFHLETGSFASKAAARTFLARSGLVG